METVALTRAQSRLQAARRARARPSPRAAAPQHQQLAGKPGKRSCDFLPADGPSEFSAPTRARLRSPWSELEALQPPAPPREPSRRPEDRPLAEAGKIIYVLREARLPDLRLALSSLAPNDERAIAHLVRDIGELKRLASNPHTTSTAERGRAGLALADPRAGPFDSTAVAPMPQEDSEAAPDARRSLLLAEVGVIRL